MQYKHLLPKRMSSLGFRRDCDHIAERAPVRVPRGLPQTAPVSAMKVSMLPSLTLCVPRGLVPTLAYSVFAFIFPFLFLYIDIDFSSSVTKGVTIGISAIAALIAVVANDCCCWYNMMLAFHTALEVKVIDKALAFAYADGTTDTEMALAITGAVVVIVHLVPFFVSDRLMFLSLLAFAGVVVNTSILVFLDSSMILLLVAASALALLSVTMIISGVCEVKTSLVSLLRDAVVAKRFITFDGFEL